MSVREGWIGGAAHRLSLAAAPTFAILALLTATDGGGSADILCAGMHDASPLSGMAPMYVLMSVFHSAPWLKLISSSRRPNLCERQLQRADERTPYAPMGRAVRPSGPG